MCPECALLDDMTVTEQVPLRIEPLITARDVAERLGMTPDWVLDKWEAGLLPGFRLGSRKGAPVRFRWSEIDAWLETRLGRPELVSSRLEGRGV
jgi:predicted DNA-binding transcriptional regulator AlpA